MSEELIIISGVHMLVSFEYEPEDPECGVLECIDIVKVQDPDSEQDWSPVLDEDTFQEIEDKLWNMKFYGKDL